MQHNLPKNNLRLVIFLGALGILAGFISSAELRDDRFASYVVDPRQQEVQFYWRDAHNRNFGSIQRLKTWLAQHNANLVFGMNGGMYAPGGAPQGLFIQQQRSVVPLDTTSGSGNFYLKPNGVFYLTTDKTPVICATTSFRPAKNIAYATQSGPLLLRGGVIHPAFTKGSGNLAIRNGVGILPGNKIVFAISREKVNFYDFAAFFKSIGCANALYLDGYVSRMYLPEKNWQQTDGNFGVIIGVTTRPGSRP